MTRTAYATTACSLGLALFTVSASQVVAIVGQPIGWGLVAVLIGAAVPVVLRNVRVG